MKHKHLYITAFFATALFASCSDYLDELPDNRTELTTEESVTRILVSAILQLQVAKLVSCIVIISMKTVIYTPTFSA